MIRIIVVKCRRLVEASALLTYGASSRPERAHRNQAGVYSGG